MNWTGYLIPLEISFRRIRVGLFWWTVGIFFAGRIVAPMKLGIIDCSLAIPLAFFTTWLGARLFSEDAGDIDEGWLRTLPMHPSSTFAVRAGLGVLLIVLMSSVQASVVGWQPSGQITIGNTARLLYGPSDHSLHFAYLLALFACTAWLARGITYATDSKYSGWWAILLVTTFAFHEVMLRFGLHALVEPGLWLMTLVGLTAAGRASARRDADLHAHSRGQAPVCGLDLLLAGSAQVLLVTLPFVLLLGCITKALVTAAPVAASFVTIILFVGLMPALLAFVRARKERLPLAQTLGSTALSWSVIGWGLEWLAREPRRNTYWIGPWPWPRNSGGPQLVGAAILGVGLVWLSSHRPFQQWVVRSTENNVYTSVVEWRLDGKPMGLAEASGWRLGWDSFTNPLYFEQGMTHHQDTPGPEFSELVAEVPSGKWTAHLGDRQLRIRAINHNYRRSLMQRAGIAGALVSTQREEEEIKQAIHDLVVHQNPREVFDVIGDMGPGGWIIARRHVGARYLAPQNLSEAWRRITPDQERIREQLMGDLVAMLPWYYGPLEEAETFDKVLEDLEARKAGAGRLRLSHWNEELRKHFKATEPCLRAFASMTGEARVEFDRWLASADPHAAMAAGLRGEAGDFDLIEGFLHRRMSYRGVIGGGLKRLDTDQIALAYGWALFAIDRERATEVMAALLGRPDPLPAELLAMAPEPPAELLRWTEADWEETARAWRLQDNDDYKKLRARFDRALQEDDFDALDYMEQAPGFAAFVAE